MLSHCLSLMIHVGHNGLLLIDQLVYVVGLVYHSPSRLETFSNKSNPEVSMFTLSMLRATFAHYILNQ